MPSALDRTTLLTKAASLALYVILGLIGLFLFVDWLGELGWITLPPLAVKLSDAVDKLSANGLLWLLGLAWAAVTAVRARNRLRRREAAIAKGLMAGYHKNFLMPILKKIGEDPAFERDLFIIVKPTYESVDNVDEVLQLQSSLKPAFEIRPQEGRFGVRKFYEVARAEDVQENGGKSIYIIDSPSTLVAVKVYFSEDEDMPASKTRERFYTARDKFFELLQAELKKTNDEDRVVIVDSRDRSRDEIAKEINDVIAGAR